MQPYLSIFASVAYALGVKFKKKYCPDQYQEVFFSLFSYNCLIVSGFTFMSLVHFELIFCIWCG